MHRFFTFDEANAMLPQVRTLVDELRGVVTRLTFDLEQAHDLERMHGESIEDAKHPDFETWYNHRRSAEAHQAAVDALIGEFDFLGVHVKDPVVGLVDFPGMVKGEPALLCWRYGEDCVDHWHPQAGGFQARKRR